MKDLIFKIKKEPMKNLLTLLLLTACFGFTAFAQTLTLSISGTVSDPSGHAVPHVGIDIDLRVSPMGPSFYQSTRWTNANGFYEDEIQISPNLPTQGLLTVGMYDCDSTYQFYTFNYSQGNSTFVQDFEWCGNVAPTCLATIEMDSVGGSNALLLTAMATGSPPFTYMWSTGELSQSIEIVPNPAGINYCVTVTDAQACVATDCFSWSPPLNCSAYIEETAAGLTVFANGGQAPYLFFWDNGQTGQTIQPNSPGIYCATVVSSDSCVAVACHEYGQVFGHFTLNGFVTAEGGSPSLSLQGTVYLYEYDNTNAGLTLYEQTALLPDPTLPPLPNGHAYYNFGVLPEGKYLALVLLAPNTPGYDDYLPTYYGDVQTWQDAAPIFIPHNGQLFNITLTKGDSLSGPGTINGFVSEGPGLQGGGHKRGDAVTDATVLLFDEVEKPLSFRKSDSDGAYSFEGLPYGTYKLLVDIPGLPTNPVWITLSPEEPVATLNFEVTDQGVTDAGETLLLTELTLWPNPAGQWLNVHVVSPHSLKASVEIISTLGQVLRSEEKNMAAGEGQLRITTDELSPGVYLLSLRYGNERIVKRFAKK